MSAFSRRNQRLLWRSRLATTPMSGIFAALQQAQIIAERRKHSSKKVVGIGQGEMLNIEYISLGTGAN